MTLDEEKSLVRKTLPFAREDRKKSWALFLSTLVLTTLFFVCAVLIDIIILKMVLGICAGLCFGRLFVIYHDYNHKAILQRSRSVNLFMKFFGLFSLAPMSVWNHVHDHHHDHNSQFIEIVLGSFPILTKRQFENLSKLAQIKYQLIRHPLTIAFSYLSVFVISFCLYPFIENPRKHWDGLASLVFHAMLSFLVFYLISPFAWLLGIFLPFFLMSMLGGYVFYAQHNFPGVKLMNQQEWSYLGAALNSSSYIKMNRFWRWVTANVGYHHVHHVNSRIPFYRLPEVMRSIPELQHPATTTLSPGDIRHCLSLKLWDEKQSEMVGI